MPKMTLMQQLHIWFKQKTRARIAYIAGSLFLGVGAVVLGVVTGGLGFFAYILLGLAIIGLLQAVVELFHQLQKDHGPKINRTMYVHEKSDEFKISPKSDHFVLGDVHMELKKCYLAFKDTKKLYYVNSAGQAHRVDVKDDFWFKENFNLSLGKHEPDEKLDQWIRAHVDEPHLSKTRKIWKCVLLTLALLLAIGGLVTGLPFIGIPIGFELGMIIGCLVLAILSPLIGSLIAWTKHYFHDDKNHLSPTANQTPTPDTESRLICTLGAEPQDKQSDDRVKPGQTIKLFETSETQALLTEDEGDIKGKINEDSKGDSEENSSHL
jgi:hypothetical protein